MDCSRLSSGPRAAWSSSQAQAHPKQGGMGGEDPHLKGVKPRCLIEFNIHIKELARNINEEWRLADTRPLVKAILLYMGQQEEDENRIKDIQREAAQLGALRQLQGFSIDELIEECQSIRGARIRALEPSLASKYPRSPQTEHRLNQAIDLTLREAVRAFHLADRAGLVELAIRDGLTGLYNRRFFIDRLIEELARAKRYHKDLGLILIDVDNFKAYNDLYGHHNGDRALQQISRLIQREVRSTDLVCRYGGEEFTVLLPETDKAGAQAVADKIRRTLASHNFGEQIKKIQFLTVTIGGATCYRDSDTWEAILQKADTALYQGKEKGKNRVVVF